MAVLLCWRPRRDHVICPMYRSGTRHHPCHVLADLQSFHTMPNPTIECSCQIVLRILLPLTHLSLGILPQRHKETPSGRKYSRHCPASTCLPNQKPTKTSASEHCLPLHVLTYIHPTRSNLPFPKSSVRSLNTSISHHHSKQAQKQQIKQTKQERKDTPPPSGAIIRTHSPRHNRILSLRRIFSAYPQPQFG
jgi:hypothetical protein